MVGYHGTNPAVENYNEVCEELITKLKAKKDPTNIVALFNDVETFYKETSNILNRVGDSTIAITPEAQQLYDAISDLGIEKFTATHYNPEVFLDDDTIIYALKSSQTINNLNLLTIPSLNDFIDEVRTPSSYTSRMLSAIAEQSDEGAAAVKELRHRAYMFDLYRNLSANILKIDGVPTGALAGVLDSIATKSNMRLDVFNQYRDFFINEIITKAELNYNQRKVLQSNKLEDVFKRLGGTESGTSHTAAYDSSMTAFVDEALKAVPDTYVKVYFDLETLGLKVPTGDVCQIGIHCPAKGINLNVNIHTDVVPPEALLRKLNNSTEEFTKTFNDASLPDEKTAISNFFTTIIEMQKDAEAEGKQFALVGYNNSTFDNRHIIGRANLLGVDPDLINQFRAVTKFDVYKTVTARTDSFVFPSQIKQHVYDLLDDYTNTLVTNPAHTVGERFAQPVDTALAKSIMNLGDTLSTKSAKGLVSNDTLSKSVIDGYYKQVANDIFGVLNDIGQTNKTLREQLILNNHIPKDTTIMNLISKDIEGAAQYGVKRVVDIPQINMFYDIPKEFRLLNRLNIYGKGNTTLGALTQKAYSMQRTMDRIKDPTALDKSLVDTLNELKTFAANNNIKSDIKYLRNDPNTPLAYTYAKVDYAVKQLRAGRYGAALDNFMKYDSGYNKYAFKTTLALTNSTNKLVDVFKRKSDGTYFDTDELFDVHSYFETPENLSDFKFDIQRIAREFTKYAQRDLIYDKVLENTNLISTASYKFKAIKDKLAEVWKSYDRVISEVTDEIHLNRIKKATDKAVEDLAQQQLFDFLKLNTVQKASYIYNNCAGRVTFTTEKFIADDIVSALDVAHIKVAQVMQPDGAVRVFFIADKNYTDFFKKLPKPTVPAYTKLNLPTDNYGNIISTFRSTLNELQSGMGNSLGDTLNASLIRNIDDKIPQEYLRYVIPNSQLSKEGYYNVFRYNSSKIGSISARRYINPYTASNPMKSYTASYQNVIATYDNKVQYTGMFFNKDMSISTSPLFKDLSDADINTFLKEHKEYTCAVLAQDRHCTMGYKIAKVNPTGASAITKAREMEAIIIPTNQYLKLFNVMNDFNNSSRIIKSINGFVTNTYKMGYLSTIGMVARNLMDGFIKGTMQMNSPLELPKVIAHWFDSCRLLSEYNNAYKQLLNSLDKANRFKLDKEFISNFFAKEYKGKLSEDVFNLIHEFISEGPSGGMTAEMDKYFKNISEQLGKTQSKVDGLDKAIYTYQNIVRKVFFPSIFINNINGAVEQTLRLDQYLTMVENGYTKNKAMQKVIATQFNYDAKTLGQRYVETFLPFTGFTLANFEFYCEQLARKGWVGAILRDVMTPVFDLDSLSDPAAYDYNGRVHESVFDDFAQATKDPTQFDWAALLAPNNGTLYVSQGMLYHTLNGNIKWNTHVTDSDDERKELYKVLKLNPSFMDAFQFANNPITSLYNRLLPIISDASEIINNDPKQYPYKTTNAVLINAMPLIGTLTQRYNSAKSGYTKSKDPAYILASVFGASSQFKKSDPTKFGTASKALKNLWYAQYKTNGYVPEYNPYPYYAKTYTKKSTKVYKNPIEKWLAYQYYLFVKNGLPEKYNPYVLYNGLRAPEDQFVKEPFNPNNINPLAGKRQVAYWYKLYKENNLPAEYNPYLYYPQYSKRKGFSSKPFDPDNIDPNASEKQVAYWYAMYKTKGLDDKYNPYTYYPQYSKYKDFDPNHIDPNATEKQVAYWYAMYKTKNLDDKYNPYTYYPQFAKQTKLFDPANDYDPNATEKQVKAWFAKFKESGLPDLFNPYNYYPQYSLANNTKLFDPAHDYAPNATKAQVAAWYAKYKESGLPELFNPYKYYPQYSTLSKNKKQSILNPMKLPRNPKESEVNAWYSAYKELNLPEKYNPYNYYPQFKAKPVKLDLMKLPRNPTSKEMASWYAWYKNNGKDQKYNPYNYYPNYSNKSGSSKKGTVSFSSKGATRTIKSSTAYKNYTRMYSAAAYSNRSTKNYAKAYTSTVNFYNKLYSSKGTSRIRLRLDTYNNPKALFYNISNIRYLFGRKWKYFDSKM